jgi:Predicted hydrolases of the HAD superfamily
MRIAVDFDGTVVTHEYPKIGKPIPQAIEVLKELHQAGHTLILWTYRYGDTLQEAIDYCEENGLQFYAYNANEPNEKWVEGKSRLIEADTYIDDRNLGGLRNWTEVREHFLSKK